MMNSIPRPARTCVCLLYVCLYVLSISPFVACVLILFVFLCAYFHFAANGCASGFHCWAFLKQLYPISILFLSFSCFSFSLRIYALLIHRMINSFDQYPHDLYWGDSYAQASWMDNRQKFIYSYTRSVHKVRRWNDDEKHCIPLLRLIWLTYFKAYPLIHFSLISSCLMLMYNKHT